MKTIKIFLNEDGTINNFYQDIRINQYSFQDTLLNVYVPYSICDCNISTETDDNITTTYGTNVQMGMIYTKTNGTEVMGQGYLFTFVKDNVVINNVRYVLFERLMPKEFTLLSGTQQYVLNVGNTKTTYNSLDDTTETIITSIITSARYNLDITASANFEGETIEQSDAEALQAQINALTSNMNDKQDKQDVNINVYENHNFDTTTDEVNSALNNLNAREQQTYNIAYQNQTDVGTLQTKVSNLENSVAFNERYIGQYTSSNAPTSVELTSYVEGLGYTLTNGDSVVWVQTISGATDKVYKCRYQNTWSWYEIPALESASNGSLGIIKGTYGIQNYNMLVDISSGEITHIYIKDNNGLYQDLTSYLNTTALNIENVLNGNIAIDLSNFAVYDSAEKNVIPANRVKIENKYATPSQVQTLVENYALPKIFNDLFYYDFANNTLISDESDLGNTSANIDVSSVGTKTIFTNTLDIEYGYNLSKANTFNTQLYITDTNGYGEVLDFTYNIYLVDENNTETQLASYTKSVLLNQGNNIISFDGNLNNLTDEIVVDDTMHYKFVLTCLVNTSSAGQSINVISNTTTASNFGLTIITPQFNISESKKAEIYQFTKTATYNSVDNQIEIALDTNDIPYENLALGNILMHFTIDYNSSTQIGIETPIKIIYSNNGVDTELNIATKYSHQSIYAWLKPTLSTYLESVNDYTYTFEFNAYLNELVDGEVIIDYPKYTVLELTQAEYNTLSNDGLVDNIPVVIANYGDDYVLAKTSDTPNLLIETTYSDLATLKINGNLVAGALYRITDYVTKVNGKVNNVSGLARSQEHPFDIVVKAISSYKLSEVASAIQHTGDTYFSNSNLNAWKLWYCFDNDTTRFEWADTSNGKGVIYRMIDEFENDLPYDFKNIQFKRYKITSTTDSRQSGLVGMYIGFDGNYNVVSDSTDYEWYYTFTKRADGTDLSLVAVENTTYQTSYFTKQVVIGQYLSDSPNYRGTQALNDIVFITTNIIVDITMGAGSNKNTMVGNLDITYSYYGAMCRRNIVVGEQSHNHFYECFEDNVLGNGTLTTEINYNRGEDHFSKNTGIELIACDIATSSAAYNKLPNSMKRSTCINSFTYNDMSGIGEIGRCLFDYMAHTTITGTLWENVRVFHLVSNSSVNIDTLGNSEISCNSTTTITQGANNRTMLSINMKIFQGTINFDNIETALGTSINGYTKKTIDFVNGYQFLYTEENVNANGEVEKIQAYSNDWGSTWSAIASSQKYHHSITIELTASGINYALMIDTIDTNANAYTLTLDSNTGMYVCQELYDWLVANYGAGVYAKASGYKEQSGTITCAYYCRAMSQNGWINTYSGAKSSIGNMYNSSLTDFTITDIVTKL